MANTFREQFWIPLSLSLEYQATNRAVEVKSQYVDMQSAVCTYFQRQREVYAAKGYQGGASLLTYQLYNFQHWQQWMNSVVDRVIVSFALVPQVIESERRLISDREYYDVVFKDTPLGGGSFGRDRRTVISRLQCWDALKSLQSQFHSVFLPRASQHLQSEMESIYHSTIDGLKAVTFHILQLCSTLFTTSGPSVHLTVEKRQGMIRKTKEQCHRTFHHLLVRNMDLLYNARDEIQVWMDGRYPPYHSLPEVIHMETATVHGRPITMLKELRWLQSIVQDLEFIHRPNRKEEAALGHMSDVRALPMAYKGIGKCLSSLYLLLSSRPLSQQHREEIELLPNVTESAILELQIPAIVERAFPPVIFALKECLISLSLRRLMDQDKAHNTSGVRIMQREMTMIVDKIAHWTDRFVSYFHYMTSRLVPPEPEEISQLARLGQKCVWGNQAIERKKEQIDTLMFPSPTDTANPKTALPGMVNQMPLLRHYLSLVMDPESNDASQNTLIRRYQDGIALLQSNGLYMYPAPPNDEPYKDSIEVYLHNLQVKAIECLEVALAENMEHPESDSHIKHELVSRVYDKIADMLAFHLLATNPDEEESNRVFDIIQDWVMSIHASHMTWCEADEDEANPDSDNTMVNRFLAQFEKCSILCLSVGIDSMALFFDSGLYGMDQLPSDEFGTPGLFTMFPLFAHIKGQLILIRTALRQVYKAAKLQHRRQIENDSEDENEEEDDFNIQHAVALLLSSLSQPQLTFFAQTMFWIEKVLIALALDFEARDYVDDRILRPRYVLEDVYNNHFKELEASLANCLEWFDLRDVFERDPQGIPESTAGFLLLPEEEMTPEIENIKLQYAEYKNAANEGVFVKAAVDIQNVMKSMFEAQC